MQTRTDIIAALLLGVIAIACGEERSPWSGFPLFPEDAGPALSPELESSLRAAQIAFVTQLAAEQAKAAGATAASEPSPGNADAGSVPPQRMAAEMAGRPGNGAKSDEPRKRENAPDAAMMAGRAAPDMHNEPPPPPPPPSPDTHNEPPPMQPSAPSSDTPMGGQAGSVGPSTPPTQPSEPDAGVMMSAGAGAMMTAGMGGSAGMMAPPSDDPMQLDAAVPADDDAADGGI
jgi:hypothetical protein